MPTKLDVSNMQAELNARRIFEQIILDVTADELDPKDIKELLGEVLDKLGKLQVSIDDIPRKFTK